MAIPPDGGFGWVIVIVSFLCNFVMDGIMFSYGLTLPVLSNSIQITESKAAIIGSIQVGMYLLGGPFVSALVNKYGFRVIAITGGLVSCASTFEILTFFKYIFFCIQIAKLFRYSYCFYNEQLWHGSAILWNFW